MKLFHWDVAAFSGEECDAIVALASADALAPGTVWNGSSYHVDPALRSVDTSYHSRNEATAWIHERVDALFTAAAAVLEVEVGTMAEPLQVMRYGAGSHFKTWHSDAGTDLRASRILSVSVELSDLSDHEGGHLEIAPSATGPRTLPRGKARVFRSGLLHRVTPVTRGIRYSLVAWAGQAGAKRPLASSSR